jgi:hypothetical protein
MNHTFIKITRRDLGEEGPLPVRKMERYSILQNSVSFCSRSVGVIQSWSFNNTPAV